MPIRDQLKDRDRMFALGDRVYVLDPESPDLDFRVIRNEDGSYLSPDFLTETDDGEPEAWVSSTNSSFSSSS